MCQPKIAGGRRCPVHHPSTTTVKSLIKANHPQVHESQLNYVFNSLRQESPAGRAPSQQEYQRFLTNLQDNIHASDLSSTKQARLDRQIEKAIACEQIPDKDTFFALKQFTQKFDATWEQVQNELSRVARRQRRSRRAVMNEFKVRYAQSTAERRPNYGQEIEPRTARVLADIRNSANMPQYETTPRVQHQPTGQVTINSYGYDPEDGRFEVRMRNQNYAFHSVPQRLVDEFRSNPRRVLTEIAQDSQYCYESQEEANEDAYRVFCEPCDRYVTLRHNCDDPATLTNPPAHEWNVDQVYSQVFGTGDTIGAVTDVTTPVWAARERETATLNDDEIEYRMGTRARGTTTNSLRIQPKPSRVRELMAEGKEVEVELGRMVSVRGTDGAEHHKVSVPAKFKFVNGNVQVEQDIDYSQIKCTCDAYRRNGRCNHIYPSADSTALNSFLKKDILRGALRIRGYNQQHELWTERRRSGASFVLTEEEANNSLTPERLAEMRYALQVQDVSNFRFYKEQEDEHGNLHLEPLSTLQFNGTTVTSNNSAHQRAFHRELTDSNYLANRLAQIGNDVTRTWEARETTRTPYLRRFNNSDGYLSSPEAFLEDYKEILADRTPLALLPVGATQEFLSSSGGRSARGFGVELEFTSGNPSRIAQSLGSAGLSENSSVLGYHGSSSRGYRGWNVENDCSVSGEIVSPILYDNEESWAALQQVCEIARSHGAQAGTAAGSHVHIGSVGLDRTQVLGVYNAAMAHQDVIRRLSANPERGSHRTSHGNGYVRGFEDGDIASIYQSSGRYYLDRHMMVNYNGGRTFEFRDPDASLEAAHIQAQVMMASAVVAAGQRGDWDGMSQRSSHRQVIGMNAAREAMISSETDEDSRILAGGISLMATLDSLFPNRESRKHMLKALLRNPWQGRTNRNSSW